MSIDSNSQEPLVTQSVGTDDPFFWESCCFRVDPRATVFACQFIISFMVLALCVTELLSSDSCETQSFYGSILSTIIGIWMPSPLSK